MFLKLGQVLVNGSSRLLTPTADKSAHDLVVQAPVCLGSATCLRKQPGASIPGCKNRGEDYYREQMEYLKTINCSEFVNFSGNLHQQMCKRKKRIVFGLGEPP